MLQAVAIGGAGIGAIKLVDVPKPTPGAGEVLVRLTAATLNYRDFAFASGRLPGMTKEPEYVPLSCAAAVVEVVGEGVARVKIGERVQPIFALGWLDGSQPTMDMLGGFADGVARQYACFPADSLVHLPDMLSDMEAATLTCAGLTAWAALTQHRQLQPGEWVLCPGTGGVSIAALQFAKAMGAHVVVTSSSDDKLTRAKALGADICINYRTDPDWPAEVRKAVGGGVDIVVDVVGADDLEANLSLLNEGGLIATIGMLGHDFSWGKEPAGDQRFGRISVGNRTQHEAMLAFIVAHAIKPVVDVIYPLEAIQDAFRHLEKAQFFGKIGISLS
jgi:NADPH:quinone reductase-like Zn-dependent oxidoreductase